MNALDVGILIIIAIFAVGGLRRGFLLGLVDLFALGLSLVLAARFANSFAEPLGRLGLRGEFALGVGFLVAAVVGLAIIGLVARILLAPVVAIASTTPLGWANSVLGLLPGTIRGVAFAALLVLLIAALPPELGVRDQIATSQLAEPVADTGRSALDAGLGWAGIDLPAFGMPYRASGTDTIALPFSGITDLHPDAAAEQTLLEWLNLERAVAGMSPLRPDSDLAELGRRHARDMFDLGFFGHTSPITGSPADRFASAGLTYALSGENIGLASTAQQAHDVLMNSPPHRANILNPGFTQVGIAVLHSPDHGLMVTQEFAGA